MKPFITGLCFVALHAAIARAQITQDVLQVDGRVYSNAIIKVVSPINVSVRHRSGAVTLATDKLPADLRQRLGWSPAAASAENARLQDIAAAANTPEAKAVEQAAKDWRTASANLKKLEAQRAALPAQLAALEKKVAVTEQNARYAPTREITVQTTIPATPARYDSNGRLLETGAPNRPGPPKNVTYIDKEAQAAAQAALPGLKNSQSQLQSQMTTLDAQIPQLRQQVSQLQSDWKKADDARQVAEAKRQAAKSRAQP